MDQLRVSTSALPGLAPITVPAPALREPALKPFYVAPSVAVLAWAVRVVSFLNLFNAVSTYQVKYIFHLGRWLPFEICEGHHLRMFLMAVLLLFLASGLQRGKRLAWQMTIGCLVLAPLLHWGRETIWPQILINLTVVGFLLQQRDHFATRSDARSARASLAAGSLLLIALIVFGTVRLYALRAETSGPDTWSGCFQAACELVLVHRSFTQAPQTPLAEGLFVILRTGGTSIILVGFVLALRPVALRKRRGTAVERKRAGQIEEQFGNDPFNAYALLDDKNYLFACEGRAVIPYSVSHNVAVALADPAGPAGLRGEAVSQFIQYCRRQDWEPVFYGATEQLRPACEEAGLSLFKIGEEARLRAESFLLKGNEFQNLRTICNRARRLGMTFRWYPEGSELDRQTEHDLATISQAWLRMKGAREMTFDMGSFSLDDIRRHGAGIASDASGRPIAFATWRPFQQGRGRTLDLMRHLPDARNVMDYVLVESIAHFRAQGIGDISLGLAPLANTEEEPALRLAEDRAVRFLFENLNRIYGYKTLFEFKRKYRPAWKSRYVAYRRGVNLPLVGLALVRIHARDGLMKFILK